MKCYFTYDPKTKKKVLIPMCYSTIHSREIEDCSCLDPLTEYNFTKEKFNSVLKAKNKTIKSQEAELNYLRSILKKQNGNNH